MSRQLLVLHCILLLALAIPEVNAQNGHKMARQAWLSTYWYWNIGDHYVFNQDVALQQGMGKEIFTRIFARSQLNRRLGGNWSLHGGLIMIGTRDALDSNTVELRPWAGIRTNWPNLGRIALSHYVRLEYRFLHEYLPGFWDPGFRFRYRIGATIPINHPDITKGTFFAGGSYELFSNNVGDMSEKGRVDDFHKFDLGIGYVLSRTIRIELMFVNLDAYEDTRERYLFTDQIYQMKFRKYFNND